MSGSSSAASGFAAGLVEDGLDDAEEKSVNLEESDRDHRALSRHA